MPEYVCIVCPAGCILNVQEIDGKVIVSGNECARGAAYGENELKNPVRLLTSTVAISGAIHPRLPVASSQELPKALIAKCLEEVYKAKAAAPVRKGQVIIPDVCGTGVDIVASRSMAEAS
jgi:CxxC motif-containing protein